MNFKEKVVSFNTLKKRIERLRKSGKTIVFTNGCFDILHLGHVAYLEGAKKKNRVLIVGLNSDKSVRRLKGKHRPIVSQNARAGVLAGLAAVDFVTIFNEETPEKLIQLIKPDVLIKGADWKGKGVAGADFVKSYGGKIEFIKFLNHFSTTSVIQSLLSKCAR